MGGWHSAEKKVTSDLRAEAVGGAEMPFIASKSKKWQVFREADFRKGEANFVSVTRRMCERVECKIAKQFETKRKLAHTRII